MNSQLRKAIVRVNQAIARIPYAARAYVRLVGWISRSLPSGYLRSGIYNQMAAIRWPFMELPATEVELAPGFTVKMIPHLEEFDFRAHFDRQLSYEREVFQWLGDRKYKTVFEIGANVGVYTLLFSKLVGPQGEVFAFEPSLEAFLRLTENLRLNSVTNVTPLQCAVAAQSGFVQFYEPQGHLTNGSLLRDFAALFDDQVSAHTSVALAGSALDKLVRREPLLLKVDVEGAEELILRSMEALIVRRSPDIVLEVLPQFEDGLNSISFLKECGYRFFNLTAAGPVERDRLVANSFRDYALVAE